jgi:hypothetical protein
LSLFAADLVLGFTCTDMAATALPSSVTEYDDLFLYSTC